MSSGGVLIFGKKISEGTFGKVVNSTFYHEGLVLSDYEGEPLESGTQYAIKVPKGEDLQREMDNLRMLGSSPYIIKWYGKASLRSRRSRVVMVMELLSTTLGQRMRATITMRRDAFPQLLKNVFKAVAFLDARRFVHRDLHYNNVMFGNSNVPKLIDFGLAKRVDRFVPFVLGPEEHWRVFHPPEQRMKLGNTIGYGECTRKFDVYSMAMNMIEFMHDPSKNMINAPFHHLMRSTILRSMRKDFTFKYLDTRDSYPTSLTLNEDILVENSALSDTCTYFRLVDGLSKLVLRMPLRLGSVLKRCLMFEHDRPSAPEVVSAILNYENPPRPLAQRFGRGRGRGRGLSRGRGRGRGLPRDLDVSGKRKRLRF